MCSEPTEIDRALTTCEALVAEQKEKIRQLEENLQEEIELRRKLEAQYYPGCFIHLRPHRKPQSLWKSLHRRVLWLDGGTSSGNGKRSPFFASLC
jgi:hypothetical protein